MSDPDVRQRRVLYVAGAGRSGTSTMAGLVRITGLHVPQPEVAPDESNPKGFNEPQWVVDHHDRLLRRANVQVSDARPEAWAAAAGAVSEEELARTAAWLEEHLAGHPELVVKDPRLSWFLPMWHDAAVRAGATPVFATMLRPPAEVVGSRQTYYGSRLGPAHLVASWLNVLLHTEHATRDSGRVFVRYADLLGDWSSVVRRVGERLGLESIGRAGDAAVREGDGFVDPSLRRMTQTLDDLALPRRLHDLTAQAWEALDGLAEPEGDTPEARRTLDTLREGYVELYQEAEAISRSSVVAAEHRVRREQRPRPPAPPAPSTPAGADRVPHGLRAAVPAPLRRGLRRLLRRPR